MAVKFSVAEGGFIQDLSAGGNKIEFRIRGSIENPILEALSAPAYTSLGLDITNATLVVARGQVGFFRIDIRSTDTDGTNELTHISQTVEIDSAGDSGQALTIDESEIEPGKVIKMYVQYISGSISSDISVTLD